MNQPHGAHRKHAFLGFLNTKTNKLLPRKKVALGLLHNRLGHISTRSLKNGYTANVCQDIELRIDPDPFCTSYQIYLMNKKARSTNLLKLKAPFKWVLWN